MAVRWGTRGDQRTVEGTLGTLPAQIRQSGLKPPALIIVGEVVSLRGKLNWFEKLPLFGVSVVVTRAREQAAGLSARLRDLGAGVIELPTIETRPPADWGPLDRAIAGLNTYDWLIFTSANGVRYFTQRLDEGAGDLRDLRAKICAIGPATADAVESLHLKVDLMPGRIRCRKRAGGVPTARTERQENTAATRRGGARCHPAGIAEAWRLHRRRSGLSDRSTGSFALAR